MAKVLVLGAGIVGLNTALRIARETKHKVTLWAANLLEITSAHSGAFWWPAVDGGEQTLLNSWAMETFDQLKPLDTTCGIICRKIIGVSKDIWEMPDWFNKIPGARQATKSELDELLMRNGYVIESAPVIEPIVHLQWLRDQLISLGVNINLRKVDSLDEALKECPLVVNCTGIGAKELCHDDDLHPVSGQLVHIRPSNIEDVIFIGKRPERTAYIIPQPSYTVLGGTYLDDDWSTEPDGDETIKILERCNDLCPNLMATEKDVIRGSRALRPVRSAIRLEVEALNGGHVIHNYGQGRSGFSLAYGCAGDVVKLVDSV